MASEGVGKESERVRIYQLMVRHFGNVNETRTPNGSLEQNGCGKFADINDAALASLRAMGFSHLWLTGVLEQASATAYPGRPADDPDILKGKAGSPYAIKDYFDVSPDYAVDPGKRLAEFRSLVRRCERHGLRVLIDLVPNHVARSYDSDILPGLSFGRDDDRGRFFTRDNNFYYLNGTDPGGGAPLKLPAADQPGCDGLFEPESDFGRVTGNNVRSWAPSIHDWYETVKLNYGHDYSNGRDTSHLPGPDASAKDVPDTWRKMDAVIDYWQQLGVDGFRVDMAHMVPLEFWRWAVQRARDRKPDAYFMAEAYDNDPSKLTDGNVLDELLAAGFDAVYDDPTYDLLMQVHEGPKWANDLAAVAPEGKRFHASVRYAENHDEVRLANPQRWGGLGMKVGKPVSAILFGMGRGPLMVYNGQEVGEPAAGAEGFSGDDARTTIFDYWSLPELTKWTNEHRYDGARLFPDQRDLRDWYSRLIHLCAEPAFARGDFAPVSPANGDNPDFGRVGDETHSGHYLYAFLRSEARAGGQSFLVVANLHGSATLKGVKVRIPADQIAWMQKSGAMLTFTDRLATTWSGTAGTAFLPTQGVALPDLPPCSALYLEIE
ncbi:MAG: alpha-amylase [Akkermansiaceae bacterium]|nr:alpha-amylase [Akkermansiaceae bacterium]